MTRLPCVLRGRARLGHGIAPILQYPQSSAAALRPPTPRVHLSPILHNRAHQSPHNTIYIYNRNRRSDGMIKTVTVTLAALELKAARRQDWLVIMIYEYFILVLKVISDKSGWVGLAVSLINHLN